MVVNGLSQQTDTTLQSFPTSKASWNLSRVFKEHDIQVTSRLVKLYNSISLSLSFYLRKTATAKSSIKFHAHLAPWTSLAKLKDPLLLGSVRYRSVRRQDGCHVCEGSLPLPHYLCLRLRKSHPNKHPLKIPFRWRCVRWLLLCTDKLSPMNINQKDNEYQNKTFLENKNRASCSPLDRQETVYKRDVSLS